MKILLGFAVLLWPLNKNIQIHENTEIKLQDRYFGLLRI